MRIKIEEGLDVTSLLKILKYERSPEITIAGDAAGSFPTNLISISDELNLLSYPNALKEIPPGEEIVWTLKNDGSSTTFIWNNGEFKACSRRLEMKEGGGYPWAIEKLYNIREKMANLNRNIAIQMESTGPKFNGNKLELKDTVARIFRIRDLDTRTNLGYREYRELAVALGIPVVEEIGFEPFNPEKHTIEFFRSVADAQTWPSNGKPAEGIVISTVKPLYSEELGKTWSAKVINQDYKQ